MQIDRVCVRNRSKNDAEYTISNTTELLTFIVVTSLAVVYYSWVPAPVCISIGALNQSLSE